MSPFFIAEQLSFFIPRTAGAVAFASDPWRRETLPASTDSCSPRRLRPITALLFLHFLTVRGALHLVPARLRMQICANGSGGEWVWISISMPILFRASVSR